MDEPTHIPVLVTEVLTHLVERPEQQVATTRGAGSAQSQGRLFIDGTVGQGGHAEAILSHAGPGCRILGFDRDSANLAIAKRRLERFGTAVTLVEDSYANVKAHAYAHGFDQVDGILLDLGFSSAHIDDPERGFSFAHEGPLDMRYDRSGDLTAEGILNGWSVDDLSRIFRIYGEEPAALQIAKTVYAARKKYRITTTTQFADLVETVVHRHGKTHPATKVFQALRIAVNDELGQFERVLPDMVELLKPAKGTEPVERGGRIAIISFHSLEDRIAKHYFSEQNGATLNVITKRPVGPSDQEVRSNPRSRSAKLRVAEKI